VFNPFAGDEPLSKTGKVVCPQCGHATPVREDPNVITGPVSRPAVTKIEESQLSDKELGFTIPGQGLGKNLGLLFFGIVWSAFIIGGVISVGHSMMTDPKSTGAGPIIGLLMALFFVLIGAFLIYAALDLAYGRRLLYLGPERVRLHHELFGIQKKNRDLLMDRIGSVGLRVEWSGSKSSTRGGRVCNIVIKGPDKQILFGSDLTEDERRWLCYRVREFVSQYTKLPD